MLAPTNFLGIWGFLCPFMTLQFSWQIALLWIVLLTWNCLISSVYNTTACICREGKATAHTTDADARSFEITGLDAGVTYLVRIAAVNINGSGEYTPWKEATTYAVELDGRYYRMTKLAVFKYLGARTDP